MGRKTTIKVGSRNGKLTVVNVETFGAGRNAVAVCLCDCGNTTRVIYQNLGKMKSCGCSQYDKSFIKKRDKSTYPTLPKGEAMMNSLYSSTRSAALRRSLDFDMTKEDFINKVTSDCEYCGAAPPYKTTYRKDGSEMYNGGVNANGLDRVDNSIGYTNSNTVSCCTACNLSKHTRSKESFLEHCLSVTRKSFPQLIKEQNEHCKTNLVDTKR